MGPEAAPHVGGQLLEVLAVPLRQDDPGDAIALGRDGLSLMPPTGITRPARVSSPVMAKPLRGGAPVAREYSAAAMVIPAEGPSFGVAPAGTWR